MLAAGVGGDLVGDAPAQAYELRVTTVFRREDGEWRVVHRHADPVPDSEATQTQLGRLSEAERDR